MVKRGGPCQGPGENDGAICGVTEISGTCSWRRGGKFKPEHSGKACCPKRSCRIALGVIVDPDEPAESTTAPPTAPPAAALAAAPAAAHAAGSAAAVAAGAFRTVASAPLVALSNVAAALSGSRTAPAPEAATEAAGTGAVGCEPPAHCYCVVVRVGT